MAVINAKTNATWRKQHPKAKYLPKDRCLMIQWSELTVNDQKQAICPDCGEPAELVRGITGEPCYAHQH